MPENERLPAPGKRSRRTPRCCVRRDPVPAMAGSRPERPREAGRGSLRSRPLRLRLRGRVRPGHPRLVRRVAWQSRGGTPGGEALRSGRPRAPGRPSRWRSAFACPLTSLRCAPPFSSCARACSGQSGFRRRVGCYEGPRSSGGRSSVGVAGAPRIGFRCFATARPAPNAGAPCWGSHRPSPRL